MDGSLRRKTLVSQVSSGRKQTRNGYESSDAETLWPEGPWIGNNIRQEEQDQGQDLKSAQIRSRNSSPGAFSKRNSVSMEPLETSPPRASLGSTGLSRRSSKSPYLLRHEEVEAAHQRRVSPGKPEKDTINQQEFTGSIRRRKHVKDDENRASDRSNARTRASSASRPRFKEKESHNHDGTKEQRLAERKKSPFLKTSVTEDGYRKHTHLSGEINEMIANAKISSRAQTALAPNLGTTEPIVPGELFFSQDYSAAISHMNNGLRTQRPNITTQRSNESQHQQNKSNSFLNQSNQNISASAIPSHMGTNYSSALTRQSSYTNDASGKTTESNRKFVANRQTNQAESWFLCIKKGCSDGKKSPKRGSTLYEAAVIKKTFVVENIRQFWADKYQPLCLSGFTFHKQEALLLKQLANVGIFPHILFKGPPGSGKKSLTMALLHDIFGPPVWNISHELRHFYVQETQPMEVTVPISSSPHHVELNVNSKSNAMYALMALVKQMSAAQDVIPEISTVNMKTNYKVLILSDVDKAEDRIQHLIKWVMDCYTDSCKLILFCEDDENILESVRSRCKVIDIEAPVTPEIMEVLSQIARKENFELPMSFAAKIANKSRRNMRKAIMALEACKAHNYPFAEEQIIPVGWEDALVELTSDILADPSPNKLFMVRGQLRKLLASFVHPKLILLKLVDQFLKGVDAGTKRELYYWHAYYDKRLPSGTSALLKLEEFIAKFMSIQRRTYSRHES